MEDTQSRRTILLIITAALLLHLGALLFLLAWQHHTKEQEKKFREFLEELSKKEILKQAHAPETPEWAEMKARASEFGTTVYFQDEPEFTPAAPAATATPTQKKQEKKASAAPEEEQKIIHDALRLAQETPELGNKGADEKKQNGDDAAPLFAQQAQQPYEGLAGSHARDAAPKPPITLSTIAKGFLSTLDDGGTDSLSMRGKKGGHVSAEQLNYQRYMEKFARCVSNSHNIHKHRLPQMNIRVPISVFVRLLRDGTLAESRISVSSGIREIDDYVLFIHRDAAPGFPPVPSSIKDELLQFVSQGVVIIGQEETPFRFSTH